MMTITLERTATGDHGHGDVPHPSYCDPRLCEGPVNARAGDARQPMTIRASAASRCIVGTTWRPRATELMVERDLLEDLVAWPPAWFRLVHKISYAAPRTPPHVVTR